MTRQDAIDRINEALKPHTFDNILSSNTFAQRLVIALEAIDLIPRPPRQRQHPPQDPEWHLTHNPDDPPQ